MFRLCTFFVFRHARLIGQELRGYQRGILLSGECFPQANVPLCLLLAGRVQCDIGCRLADPLARYTSFQGDFKSMRSSSYTFDPHERCEKDELFSEKEVRQQIPL